MKNGQKITVDGNEAAASVAYRTSEVIAIYPITPSSPMGELSDEWSSRRKPNIWGNVPEVVEMQSEGGASGAVHGALQAGALTATFTSSQGLLLMIPNMYKIAGELNAFCMHVAARSVATHALSIFADHSDVMACRQTGFAMLSSNSVQEAHDLASIAHASTLRSRVPFLHFFDGFRTSHEVARIDAIPDEVLQGMIDDDAVAAHRQRALSPDHPVLRGSAQNPDVFFQAREAGNPFYLACPATVRESMDRFAELTGRRYRLFDYVGHPEAERVIVMMGSGAEAAHEAVEWMAARGEKVGLVKVRLYRPFSTEDLLAALPVTTRAIAALDRTKEPGSVGEPLYLDVVTALSEAQADGTTRFERLPRIVGGRYGLGSKEFTPAMVHAVLDNLSSESPRNHFTIGIMDDVTGTSLTFDPDFDVEPENVMRAVFYGLGADGTVGANKNSIKIISEGTDRYAQGYFVYDSKKSGAVTISHVRFGPEPLRTSYLIRKAGFVACHQYVFMDRYDILERAADGAILLLNAPYGPEEVWDHLPREAQESIIAKKVRLFVIDAVKVARDAGMGGRINTVMQTCFFAISGVLPRDEAIARIKKSIEKTYGRKGEELVRRNFAAVDSTLEHLHEVKIPAAATAERRRPPVVSSKAPDFVQRVTAVMLSNQGDLLPVSAFPVDGTWPVGTSQWEKRNIALTIPVWDEKICIQCNKCAFVCPHAAIRAKVYPTEALPAAPETFKSTNYRASDHRGAAYTIQVAPEDCTGCNLCVMVCPAKDKTNPRHKALDMHEQAPLKEPESVNYEFFLALPEADRTSLKTDVKGSQFLQPLFEYSGACSGCGETPYVKLLTQLFGDRIIMANATGCSSIYGGNLPTAPYTTNRDGRGPAWSNSLFEDNAEFGLGMRLAVDRIREQARSLLEKLAPKVGDELAGEILSSAQEGEEGIRAQRERVEKLRAKLSQIATGEAKRLAEVADYLVRKAVWIVGGDGWAYDIGYGGLDHVLALGRDVNVLVLDTEVYSNTGGQQSKATPMGAAAKFAMAGKGTPKKDLGMLAMSYGNVYVARVAFGAKDTQTVRAFAEAESYPGPSIIIAYSPCIAHGYEMSQGLEQQRLAMETGYWPLLRFDPRRRATGENPLQLDSPHPRTDLVQFARNEVRFRMVEKLDPQRFRRLMTAAQREVSGRFAIYEELAKLASLRGDASAGKKDDQKPTPAAAARN
ncbi:MAG TPA: pyruvate:ferredoxin (flavodoxin) oxidoreductase [Candidatus Saccharimonadales bacterium]|nr:pyruvate:ferredoxin (flavodoxin) oxidoreductase [Candidatus Saccharimonadales bacterium]